MPFNICVAGATGNVGRTMLKILEERNFPVDRIRLLASSRSVGKTLEFRGTEVPVEELTPDSFEKGEVVLSSPGGSVSKWYVPSAVKSGQKRCLLDLRWLLCLAEAMPMQISP